MKILIVEDSKLVSERLRLALMEQPGVDAVAVNKLESGLRQFRLFHPHLVILDIDLADGSGMVLLSKVKHEAPGTLVAMFTNHPGYRHRCATAGADYFFDKACDFERLSSTVQQLAEARP